MGNIVTDRLIKAGLLNEVQIQVALHDQTLRPEMRLSEILALRGWIDEETVDFFELVWDMRVSQPERKNIGEYFLEARLITEAQIEDVLAEQKMSTLLFGEIAVLKGYLKQETVRFFVQHLFPDRLKIPKVSPLSRITQSTHSQAARQTMSNDNTMQQIDENDVAQVREAYAKEKRKSADRQGANRGRRSPSGKQENPKQSFFHRLTNQVKDTMTSYEQSKQPKNPPPTPLKKKKPLSDEASSTRFDLSDADDFNLDDI